MVPGYSRPKGQHRNWILPIVTLSSPPSGTFSKSMGMVDWPWVIQSWLLIYSVICFTMLPYCNSTFSLILIQKLASSTYSLILHLIFFFEKEREREREVQRVRERERENPKQPPCCWHRACLMQSLNPQTMKSWPEAKPRAGSLTDWATQVPLSSDF